MKYNPSQDSLTERCKRICGSSNEECIIDTPTQMTCIADMVINKTFSITLTLKHALSAVDAEEATEYIGMALSSAGELSNWVKYLQVASDLRGLLALGAVPGNDKRRETRYPLPEVYRQYIVLQATGESGTIDMSLHNFSQSGFQARSPKPIRHDELLHCSLCLRHKEAKSARLSARVKYCEASSGGYIIGAAIEDVPDSAEFNFFNNVFSLMMELGGNPPT